jgi:hypothetical protein
MKKSYAIVSGILIIASLIIVQSVHAANKQPVQETAKNQTASILIERNTSFPQVSISTPSYPVGMRSKETILVPYRLKEMGNVSGEIISRTLQFYTQYDVLLSEPMGPFPTSISVKSLDTTDWNELVYLPASVFDKARSMEEYAIVLKTTFQGKSQSGATFKAQASLLILFPPGLFSKITPDNRATDQSIHPLLNWKSSLGAIDYEYCFDTLDNNSCDTDWTGTYWLGTYESKAALQNLPSGTTFYWQVRANNTAGTTYANKGKWWSFTTACNTSAITVANSNDTGTGSLRQAIADICPGGTINFPSSLAGQTITLASQLRIDKDLTIDGSGLNPSLEISGGSGIRSFYISPGTTVALKFLIIKNGQCNGSCFPVNEFGDNIGGGIYNDQGMLTVQNSTLSGNSADAGGAIFNNDGTLIITNSVVSGNSAGSTAGIFNYGNLAVLTITNSLFSGNSAGVIHVQSGMATVTNSTFSGNSATIHGGAGAIEVATGIVTVTNSTFSGNSGTSGGGIITNGTTTVTNSTFSNNSASYGAGIINGGNLTVINSTFSGNSAAISGGGIYNNGTLTVTNSTVSGNSATSNGGSLFNNFGGTLHLKNTILANSSGTNDCYNFSGDTIATNINNLIETNSTSGHSCGTPALMSDPLLDSLNNNGGPTKTLALLSGSPAINAGNDATCSSTDQRGVARPYGSHCDIGAYEYQKKNGSDTTGVFRPNNGALFLKNTNATGFADISINYGLPGDKPVVGDWDGDGTVTIGIYRNGSFYLRNSNTLGFADLVFAFGSSGDQPIAGDWNGDGVDTIGVYRNGTFYLRNSNSSGVPNASFALGISGDIGIAGDWNGDGVDTTGVFRPSNGVIFLKNTNSTGFADVQINYGLPGDKPVTGDWNNDGIDTIGIYRNGKFYLRNTNTIGVADIVFALGIPGDMPIAGNWDGLP